MKSKSWTESLTLFSRATLTCAALMTLTLTLLSAGCATNSRSLHNSRERLASPDPKLIEAIEEFYRYRGYSK